MTGGLVRSTTLAALCVALGAHAFAAEKASPPKIEIMKVDEVRAGMEGVGKTVLRGTKLETFQVKILGVLKNVAPGRDLILTRLSGANLEKTGVIAGMSGSPVYVDGKLLGAVAYAWPFSKEPIAGLTPFEQMLASTKSAPADGSNTIQVESDGTMPMSALDLSQDAGDVLEQLVHGGAVTVAEKGGSMSPISIPLSASGFSTRSLQRLGKYLGPFGMLPVAAGAASEKVKANEPVNSIAPGTPMACGLVTGDMELNGMGTVTHVEGDRVWGWGHPMMASGKCHFLLRAGYIHMVNARQTISTKMGSPLSVHGVVDADIDTCIAGRLKAKPDMLPMSIQVTDVSGTSKKFQVEIVRHEAMLGALVASVLNNAIDGLGKLPAELTFSIDASITLDEMESIEVKNTYSGSRVGGTDGVMRYLNQIPIIVNGLTRNPFGKARIKSIDCVCQIERSRVSAAIESARLQAGELEPGEALEAIVKVRPFKADPVEVPVKLALPKTLPPGDYTLSICDRDTHLKQWFNEQPHLLKARTVTEVAQVYRNQLTEKPQTIYLRVALPEEGVSVEGVNLPQLPASVRAVFESRRTPSTKSIKEALVARKPTDWAIEGSTNLRFKVVENKRVSQ